MKLAIVLLAYLALAESQNLNSCPSAEDIKPCICQFEQDGRLSISCQNLKSANELVKAVVNMKGYSINSFRLDDSKIGDLPSDVFSGMEIYSLSITKSNLTKLGDSRSRPPFLGLENSLQYIEIKESLVNKNSPLALLSLSHLKKLTTIRLEGNEIPTIGNNWFENGPYGLRDLHFINDNTSVIGSHAFEALEKLEYFTLAGGSVSQITRDMFPMPAASLLSMNFRNNKLESLPDNIFSKMPSLERVYLESNLFTKIDEVVWAPIWSQLDYAYFHGNPIACNSDLKWIYMYRLPEHFAGYCNSPNELLYKDLRDIKISDLK